MWSLGMYNIHFFFKTFLSCIFWKNFVNFHPEAYESLKRYKNKMSKTFKPKVVHNNHFLLARMLHGLVLQGRMSKERLEQSQGTLFSDYIFIVNVFY